MTNFYTLIALLKTFAYFFCPLIIFFRGIWPAIVVEGSGWTGVLGFLAGIVWFLLTYIAPVNPQFLEKYIGANLAIRYYDIQTYILIVLSIILLL